MAYWKKNIYTIEEGQIPIQFFFDLIPRSTAFEESTQSITPTMMHSSICRWYVFASPLLGKHLKKQNFTYESKDIGLNKRYKGMRWRQINSCSYFACQFWKPPYFTVRSWSLPSPFPLLIWPRNFLSSSKASPYFLVRSYDSDILLNMLFYL